MPDKDKPPLMIPWINSPRVRRAELWLWNHPKVASLLVILSFALFTSPAWFSDVWALFSNDPPIPTIMNWSWSFRVFLLMCLFLVWATALYVRFANVRPSLKTHDDNARIKKFGRSVRGVAGIVAIALPSMCIVFGLYKYYSAVPAKPYIIVVADFDSLDGKNYGITENLLLKLREATKQYPDIEIQALDETIGSKSTSEDAQRKGRERNAALLLWGWNLDYRITADFEVLKKPELLNLRSPSESISGLTMNKSFELQTQVASDMNHLVLLTIGLARHELNDYDGAISLLSEAITRNAPDQMVNPSDAYFFRGTAYFSLNNYQQALSDFDQVVALDPLDVSGYLNRAIISRLAGDPTKSGADTKKAIELLTEKIERNGNDYHAYVTRGAVYGNARDYQNAIIDVGKAIANWTEPLRGIGFAGTGI